jgi:hypothetical protein
MLPCRALNHCIFADGIMFGLRGIGGFALSVVMVVLLLQAEAALG